MRLFLFTIIAMSLSALLGSTVVSSAGISSDAPHCAAFRAWSAGNKAASQSTEGVALAKVRRQELKSLIQRDPQAALGWAVGREEKAGLPKEVADELETEVAGVGYVGVLMADRATEPNPAPSVSMTVNGQVLRVFLHGSQLARKQWYGERVKGIALDHVTVLDDVAGVAVAAAPVLRTATKTVRRTYDPAKMKMVREGEFDRLELEGVFCPMVGEPGLPGLPSEVVNVALPPGAEVTGLRVQFVEQKLRDGVTPLPVQKNFPTGESVSTNFTPPNAEAYGSTEVSPKEVATLTGDQNRLGHRFVSVRVNPLRYVGATKTLYAVTDVTMEVDYELPLIAPLVSAGMAVEEAKKSVQNLVVNPGDVESPTTARDISVTGGGRVDYLIITGDALVPAFTALATLRQASHGFVTDIRTVSNIVTRYSGSDTPAKIRACIRDYLVTSNLSYVVLGGDDTVVPIRASSVGSGGPCDLYYSGLDAVLPIDMAYDVVVGRIPVRTADQAAAYIGKVAAYETNTPWQVARKIMLTGTLLDFKYINDNPSYLPIPSDLFNDGHLQFTNRSVVSDAEVITRRQYRDFVQTNGNAYSVGCLLDTLTSWDVKTVGDYIESAWHLVKKQNYGWNMRLHASHGTFLGHATEEGWYPYYGFDTNSAAALTNTTVIMYTYACSTGGFDKEEPCLSEAMLRNPQGGCLVYLGNGRAGWGNSSYYGGPSPEFGNKWLEQMFIRKEAIAGKAFAEHKLAMVPKCVDGNHYTSIQYQLNFQGDPALRLIGAKPAVTVEAVAPVTVEGVGAPGCIIVRRDPVVGDLTVTLNYSGTATGADIAESLPATLTFTDGESRKIITVTPLDDDLAEGVETLIVSVVTNALYEPGSLPATLTILDHTNLPVLVLSAPTNTICEATNALPAGDFTMSHAGCFMLTRTGDTNGAVTVFYALSGTARTTDCAEVLSGTVTLAAGQVSTNLTVTAVNNAWYVGDRNLVLTLQPASGYILGGTTSATITIRDDDPMPGVTVSTPDPTAREHSADTGTFRISRSGDLTLPLTVNFTISGTCPITRYTLPASPVSFSAGVAWVDLILTPVAESMPDTVIEEPQTVVLKVTRVEDCYSAGAAATVTLLDEEDWPPLTVTAPDATTREHSADTATFRINRAGILDKPLHVSFTLEGTCPTNRYSIPASPVIIPAGSAYVDLTVTPLDDTDVEPPQTIVLTTTPPFPEDAKSATVVMYDDDNLPPTITLATSSTNFVEGDPVTLTPTASDDWGVSHVQFWRMTLYMTNLIATVSNTPYQYTWYGNQDTSTLAAVAVDIWGAASTSPVVKVFGSSLLLPMGPGTGFSAEWWTNVVGTGIAALTNDTRYPLIPDGSVFCPSGMSYTLTSTNSFGVRLRGFYIVPMDGVYRLDTQVGGNSVACLYLSNDESPANITMVNFYTRVSLVAGRRYYFEMLYKHEDGQRWTNNYGRSFLMAGSLAVGGEGPIPYHRLEPWREVRIVATNAIMVPEGGTAQFDLCLSQAPVGAVTVTVSRVSGDAEIGIQGALSLVFDEGNWSVPQAVTLAAAEDPDTAAGVATIVCSSPDANPANVTATEADNDSNSPPVALADSYLVMENSPLAVSAPGVLVNDVDAETNALTAALVSTVVRGMLSFNADGVFTYMPNTNWSGTDSFMYRANDGQFDSEPVAVTLTVQSRPKVVYVRCLSNTTEITVRFDRAVKTTAAEMTSNYTLDSGVSVLSASLAFDQQTLTLVTTGLTSGQDYTLTINGIVDINSPTAILPDTQIRFRCLEGALPDTLSCVLWLDAGFGVTTDAGGVSRWEDLSAIADHMTQTNAALKPTLQTNAVNGLPALRFDDDRLSAPDLQLGIGAGTVFFVIKPDSVAGNTQEFGGCAPDGRFRFNNGKLSGWFGGDRDQADTNAPGTNRFQIVAFRFNGDVQESLDGQPFLAALGTKTDISESPFVVGAVSNHFNGAIAEVIAYGKPLNDEEARAVKAYLANKYNITLALRTLYQPVVSSMNVVVAEGGQTNLSVVLTAPPAGTVQYAVSRLSGSTNLYVMGSSSLTFTPANWSNAQTVVIASVWDNNMANDTAMFQLVSAVTEPVLFTAQQQDMHFAYPLPYEDTYEAYLPGMNLAGVSWKPEDTDYAEAIVTNGTPAAPFSGYPVPAVTHTNVMNFYGKLSVVFDGSSSSNLTTVALDTMIQPIFGPQPVGDQMAALSNAQTAVYFDTNGCLNIYHGVRTSPTAGPPDYTEWLAVTNAPQIQTGEWCRLTLVVNYDLAGPMMMFMVGVNSNFVSAPEGYAEAHVGSTRGGPWFISPKWSDADLRIHKLNLTGAGCVDDLTVTAGAAATATNGTPIAWMQEKGLAPGGEYPTWDSLALGDSDHDGMPTWQECIAGTDPNSGLSALKIVTNSVAASGGTIILAWPSVASRIYAIQRSTNLVSQPFADLWTNIPANPPVNVYTGTMSGASGGEFYRINVAR